LLSPLALVFVNTRPVYEPFLLSADLAGQQQFAHAHVDAIDEEGTTTIDGYNLPFQRVRLHLLDGPDAGSDISLQYGGQAKIADSQKLRAGDTVLVTAGTNSSGQKTYEVTDQYRLPAVGIVAGIFILVILLVTGRKGLGALLGLAVSLVVIVQFIVPAVVHGSDPVLICLLGASVIMLASTYLAHGVSWQTSAALGSTFCAFLIASAFADFAVMLTRLNGLGSEDMQTLALGPTSVINLQGLLLGGIIIGTLGALNDVTVTQAATIFEFSRTDRTLGFWSLVRKGSSVGREHILSLVNTLVLAYTGSALAVIIFLQLNPSRLPMWVLLNGEYFTDEVVRMLAGTAGLVLAVPITTIAAAVLVRLTAELGAPVAAPARKAAAPAPALTSTPGG
jgi:uncharacterized membrane protein